MLLFRKDHLRLLPCLSPRNPNFTSSIYRLLSTATPTPRFAVQYLINSCGLSSKKAIRAAKHIPHLKSPEKPNAVLQFLRQAGINEPHIRSAARCDPQFLCYDVEDCLKPRMAELQEIGFSPSHISLILSICPSLFAHTELQQNILFWIQIVGSVEKLFFCLRRNFSLLSIDPEGSPAPNISFLQEQCELTPREIVRVIRSAPRLITSRPEAVKTFAKRAAELGIKKSSRMFMYALVVVSSLKQSTIDAKLLHLKSLGLSQEEVNTLIRNDPCVLLISEKLIGPKMNFLIKEAGCDKSDVAHNPVVLRFSLEKRMIPRTHIWKLLKSKGLLVANEDLITYMKPQNTEQFLEKFVLPYEHAIPGLHRACANACAGNIGAIEKFKSISSVKKTKCLRVSQVDFLAGLDTAI